MQSLLLLGLTTVMLSSCLTRDVMRASRKPVGTVQKSKFSQIDSAWVAQDELLVVFARGALLNHGNRERIIALVPLSDSVLQAHVFRRQDSSRFSPVHIRMVEYPTRTWDQPPRSAEKSIGWIGQHLPHGFQKHQSISIYRQRGFQFDFPLNDTLHLPAIAIPPKQSVTVSGTNRELAVAYGREDAKGTPEYYYIRLKAPYRRHWYWYAALPPALVADAVIIPSMFVAAGARDAWRWTKSLFKPKRKGF